MLHYCTYGQFPGVVSTSKVQYFSRYNEKSRARLEGRICGTNGWHCCKMDLMSNTSEVFQHKPLFLRIADYKLDEYPWSKQTLAKCLVVGPVMANTAGETR